MDLNQFRVVGHWGKRRIKHGWGCTWLVIPTIGCLRVSLLNREPEPNIQVNGWHKGPDAMFPGSGHTSNHEQIYLELQYFNSSPSSHPYLRKTYTHFVYFLAGISTLKFKLSPSLQFFLPQCKCAINILRVWCMWRTKLSIKGQSTTFCIKNINYLSTLFISWVLHFFSILLLQGSGKVKSWKTLGFGHLRWETASSHTFYYDKHQSPF